MQDSRRLPVLQLDPVPCACTTARAQALTPRASIVNALEYYAVETGMTTFYGGPAYLFHEGEGNPSTECRFWSTTCVLLFPGTTGDRVRAQAISPRDTSRSHAERIKDSNCQFDAYCARKFYCLISVSGYELGWIVHSSLLIQPLNYSTMRVSVV